ncbi:hypothetical protein CFC21_055285, partial [Triticum aestivum]
WRRPDPAPRRRRLPSAASPALQGKRDPRKRCGRGWCSSATPSPSGPSAPAAGEPPSPTPTPASDGLHLTPEGNALVHKEVVGTLRGARLRAEVMPLDFPHHSKIDAIHQERSFQ